MQHLHHSREKVNSPSGISGGGGFFSRSRKRTQNLFTLHSFVNVFLFFFFLLKKNLSIKRVECRNLAAFPNSRREAISDELVNGCNDNDNKTTANFKSF